MPSQSARDTSTPADHSPSNVEPAPAPQRAPLSAGTRWALFIAVILGLLLCHLLRHILLPFLVAASLAYVATPAVEWLSTRLRVPRWVAATAIYILYLAIFTAMGWAIHVYAVPQVTEMVRQAPADLHSLLFRFFGGREQAEIMGHNYNAWELTHSAMAGIGEFLSTPAQMIGIGTLSIQIIMGIVLTLALLAWFLLTGPSLARGVLWIVPPPLRERAQRLWQHIHPMLSRYIRGVLLVVAYATVATFIMAKILDLPHPVLIAVIVGLLEFTPVIGPLLSVIVIALATINRLTPGMLIETAIFTTALRLSIDHFVAPVVLGHTAKIPAPVVIFAFIIGGTLYGALGILAAIPVAAAVKIVLMNLYEEESVVSSQ